MTAFLCISFTFRRCTIKDILQKIVQELLELIFLYMCDYQFVRVFLKIKHSLNLKFSPKFKDCTLSV